ncbi:MAG: response regulator [Clostridia bacterium]|nr:response regulator [Clostridia bacterium]
MYGVVLIDDEFDVVRMLIEIIPWEQLGFRVEGAFSNAVDALNTIEEKKPELVITDIRMPEMDGIEMIHYCTTELDCKSRFIIVSGYDDFTYAKKAIAYNVRNYILKPIDEDELIKAIQAVRKELSQETLPTKEILKAVEDCDESAITLIIDDIFDAFNKKGTPMDTTAIYIKGITFSLINMLSKYDVNTEMLLNEHPFVESIGVFPSEQLKGKLLQFCKACSSYIEKSKGTDSDDIIHRIKKYIDKNYDKKINIKTISQEFFINPAYLGQLFKKAHNIYITEYIRKLRIEKAAKLLRDTGMKLTEIAEKVGYEDKDYFSEQFFKTFNITPTEYRKKYNDEETDKKV